MDKTITLTRAELVWQTRQNTWTEEDFNNFVEWLKTFLGKEEQGSWYRNRAEEYKVLSTLTWEEICRLVDTDNYEEQENYRIPYYAEDGELMYKAYVSEVIYDAIREDNYDTDVISEDYADDYEEKWDVR